MSGEGRGLLSRRRGLIAALAGFGALALSSPTFASCDRLVPPTSVLPTPSRPITTDDLLRLRDIGQPDPPSFGAPSPMAVSPDGGRIAFLINQADASTNGYCRAIVVLDLRGRRPLQIVDQGGEPVLSSNMIVGLVTPLGFPELIVPAWSPDGRWLAFLRRDHGVTQLWRASPDGKRSRAVTRSPVDVKAFAWSQDGRKLIYSSVPATVAANRDIDREGLDGWLYDDRIIPYLSSRPRVPGTLTRAIFAIDPAQPGAEPLSPTAAESALLDSPKGRTAMSANGRRAWTTRIATSPFSPQRLFATDRIGREVRCEDPNCIGDLTGVWLNPAGADVWFLRREGWHGDEIAIYRWRPGQHAPRRILLTKDTIFGCVVALSELLCLRENATTPRRLVLIDPRRGRFTLVFDPNPEFAAIGLGRVEHLRWRNRFGLPSWGELVLPPGQRCGSALPMIVVQYRSSGFLRGGTGDEYPIHAFAEHGFAVLSVEMPPFFAEAFPDLKPIDGLSAGDPKDWNQRENVLSSLMAGVDAALATGCIDRRRIGITGLSDGATSAKYALINTRRFAAASISGTAVEPNTVMTYVGPAYADLWRSWGYPPATEPDPAFWQQGSLALNAGRVGVPLLMQVPDDEFIGDLEAYAALREQHQPVELYVFPDEHHDKSQPAHRRAIYQRNLDWFDFWLRSAVDPDPAKAAQYARWRAMGDQRPAKPQATD